jgi:hypothetical protein
MAEYILTKELYKLNLRVGQVDHGGTFFFCAIGILLPPLILRAKQS